MKFVILGHVFFPWNLEEVNSGLFQFLKQIKQGHSFVSTLLSDTIRALCIPKTTPSTHLECYVSLLQIWFLEQIVACKRLITKGLLQKDLIRDHLKRMWWSLFKSIKDYGSYLENLHQDQLCQKPSSLHIRQIIFCGVDDNPLLLLGFRGVERYSPIRVVLQFGWPKVTQLLYCNHLSSIINENLPLRSHLQKHA